MDRRTVLAGFAGSAVLAQGARAAGRGPESRVVRSKGRVDYGAAMDALSDYVHREMAFWGLPGMTLSVVDGDGFAATMTFGFADLDRRVPVEPGHLFQIGSITKSLTAATLLGFVDERKLDLDARLARLLPDLPWPAEAITVRHLLTHSSGLPGEAPLFPRVPGGRLWCGFQPGTSFSYCNLGYAILGMVVERLGGAPYPQVVRQRMLEPLGMCASLPAIQDRDRTRYATGYTPVAGSVPYLPGAVLVPGTWTDMDAASGSIASTADDMARYLRFLIGAARGDGGGVLSPASARAFTAPGIAAGEFGEGARYGLGLATVQVGGRPVLHHTGGMVLFASSMHVDGAAGVGCFASCNAQLDGKWRPRQITAHAIELMRAAREGSGSPAAPDVAAPVRIEGGAEVAGLYVGPDGSAVEIVARGDALRLRSGGSEGRLVSIGVAMGTDHPRFAAWPLHAAKDGVRTTGLWWAGTLYGRDRVAAQPAVPARLQALTGWYASTDPWLGGAVVRAQGDRLILDSVSQLTFDSGTELFERDDFWTPDKDNSVDRARFEAPVGGRPTRLNWSGNDLARRTFA